MDRGTTACDFLLGKVVPLRLGYVGVVNRSQEDINKNRSMQDALSYEENFFRNHPVYSGLSDRCGIPQLAKKLNQILEQHIRTVIPGLKSELNSRLNAVSKELQKYGDVMESKLGTCNVGGNSSSRTWSFSMKPQYDNLHNVEQIQSTIQLTEPPFILGPLEMTEQEAVEILVTKLLLQSYYDIVRKNVQDLVPKSIMHFVVNHAKRNLHNTIIQKLYRCVHELSFDFWVEVFEFIREIHVEELLQEHDEIAANRRHAKEVFLVLQQAVQVN